MALAVSASAAPSTVPPSIDVVVSGLTGATLTVSRSVGGQPSTVRGLDRAPALGASVTYTDYEAPFDVPASYTVTEYAASGAVVARAVTATSVTLGGIDRAWLSDPLAPALSVQLSRVTVETAQEISWSLPGDVYPVQGSAMPVSVSGVRQAAAFMLQTHVRDDAELSMLRQVVEAADPVLFRWPGAWGLLIPAACYVTARSVLAGNKIAFHRLVLECVQVRPPMAGVVAPVRTLSTLQSEAATLGDLMSQHATLLGLWRGTAA